MAGSSGKTGWHGGRGKKLRIHTLNSKHKLKVARKKISFQNLPLVMPFL